MPHSSTSELFLTFTAFVFNAAFLYLFAVLFGLVVAQVTLAYANAYAG